MYQVYAYYEPNATEPFYIGKGKRYRSHKHLCPSERASRKSHFHNKLSKMLRDGVIPKIVILAEFEDEQGAFDLERELIKEYGRIDLGTGCLCNHTDGGEGVSGLIGDTSPRSLDTVIACSRPRSKLAKQRMSEAQRRSKGVPVECVSIQTGKGIKRYPAVICVREDGFQDTNVWKVLNGTRKSHGGYFWRIAK